MLPKQAILQQQFESLRGCIVHMWCSGQSETTAEHNIESKPNTGLYIGAMTIRARMLGNWYFFVFAQDINTMLQGIDPKRWHRLYEESS